MLQILFLVICSVLGFFVLRFYLKDDSFLFYILIFPIGVVVSILILTCIVLLSLKITFISLLLAGFFLFTAILIFSFRNKNFYNINYKRLIVYILVILPLFFIFSVMDLSIISPDSYSFMIHSKFSAYNRMLLAHSYSYGRFFFRWNIFIKLLLAMSEILRVKYVFSIFPALMFHLYIFFIYSIYDLFKRLSIEKKTLYLILAIFGMFFIFSRMVLIHTFLIHTNGLSALYLFFTIVLFQIGKRENNMSYYYIAVFTAIAFTLLRIENIIILLIYLIGDMFNENNGSELYDRYLKIMLPILTFIYGVLIILSLFTTKEWIIYNLAVFLSLFGFFMAIKFKLFELFKFLKSKSSMLICLFFLSVVVLFLFTGKSDVILISVRNVISNSFMFTGSWTLEWYGIISLLIFLVINNKKIYSINLIISSTSVILFLFVLVALRGFPYRIGAGDSFNRIILVLFPIMIYSTAIELKKLIINRLNI